MSRSKVTSDFTGKLQCNAAHNSAASCLAESSEAIGGALPAMKQNRLDSWKEIAAYLQREIRTVQRWEKGEGLPIHRHYHQRIGSVYAFKEEIDAWSRSRASLQSKPRPRIHSICDSDDSFAISRRDSSIRASAVEPGNSLDKLPLPLFANLKRGFVPAIIYIDPEVLSRELVSPRQGMPCPVARGPKTHSAFMPGTALPLRANSRPRRRATTS